MNDKHVGSDFDDFLREEGLLEEVEAVAAQRVEPYHAPEATTESSAPEESCDRMTGREKGDMHHG